MNEEHLDNLQRVFWNLPNISAIKDVNSRYIAISKTAGSILFGKRKLCDAIGLKDSDIPGEAANFSEIYIDQDKIAMETTKKIMIDVNIWADGTLRAFLTAKQKYTDQSNLVGVLIHCTEFTSDYLAKILRLISQDKKIIGSSLKSYSYEVFEPSLKKDLTTRELECLAYLM